MDIRDINLPTSALIGSAIGFGIGFIIGVVSGGFILEILARSILSGIILGGTLFGVEQIIKKFAPEILEENSPQQNKVNIKEEDDISISDLYNSPYETETTESTEGEIDSYIDSSMTFSENSVFGNEVENNLGEEEIIENLKPESISTEDIEEGFSSIDFEKVSESKNTNFEPMTFSTAELGVTKQAKGGLTEDFIIPGKGKPIPKDYKKLAEAIRTKLKEE